MSRHPIFARIVPFLGLVLGLTACETVPVAAPDDTGSAGPDPSANIQLLQPLGVAEFEQTLATSSQGSAGPGVRVTVRLQNGGLVADAVKIEPTGGTGESEYIRSHITELMIGNGGGTLTLELGQLEVAFDAVGTGYRSSDGDEITMQDFLDRVGLSLADQTHPAVRVERQPSGSPQDPSDPGFTATLLRLEAEDEGAAIAINVDHDNFERNTNPPPDGWLTVLGLDIELRITDGITDIEIERPDLEKVDFEGVVESVDLERPSFTLEDGTVVLLGPRTETDHKMEHDRHRLRALAAVKEALDAGLVVIAHGRGAVVGTDPLTLVAFHVAFQLDASTLQEFEGVVESVDVEARSFTLADGTVIRVLALTHFHYGWDLQNVIRSLERVAEAIKAGHTIRAHGVGAAVTGDPSTLIAIKVAFEAEPPPMREFEGVVESVDLEHNTFTLDDGTIIHVPGYDWAQAAVNDGIDDDRYDRPWRLAAVAEAVEAGLTVIGAGVGLVKDTDPLTLLALRLRFAIERPGPEAFEGVVESVDTEARTFTLVGGLVVRVLRVTEIQLVASSTIATSDGYPIFDDPLAVVARAVAAGLAVAARGSGVIDPTDAQRIVAVEVLFAIQRPAEVQFEGEVESLDLPARSFTLTDGTVVRWGPVPPLPQPLLSFRPSHTLEAVAEALDAGVTVLAKGIGFPVNGDPKVLVAFRVEFQLDDTGAEAFEGEVATFDLTNRSFTLTDGTVVRLIQLTEVEFSHVVGLDPQASFAAAADQARDGISAHAKGRGIRVGDNPTTLVAIEVKFEIGQTS